MSTRPSRVCIVGAGPRGLSVLERLCANARRDPSHGRLAVHVVDPYPPGSGQVWRTGQSGQLLMNTVASQITVYTDDSVRIDGPVEPGPSLYDWARRVAASEPGDGLPPEVVDEARRLGPDTYSTRALYGHYLAHSFREVVRRAPEPVRVQVHRSAAVALLDDVRATGGRQLVRLADGTALGDLDAVVLVQGHLRNRPSAAEARTSRLARVYGLTYLPPGNPADADLSELEPGRPVLIRGLGLNFFDHLALLSTGRGGSFTRQGGRLVYHRGGGEPQIFAFSRRGVPHHARGENEKGAAGRHLPRLFTAELIEQLRADPHRRLQFGPDLWPLIRREVECVYYATMLDRLGRGAQRAELERGYLDRPADRDAGALLDSIGIPADRRWSWDALLNPLGGKEFADRAAFNTWALDYLDADVLAARAGNVSGPLTAALDVLRDLRNEVRLAVDHGGLDGASHRDELQAWYTPLNAFLSIGPPASRIEELAALIRAGVLQLCGPDTRVDLDVHERRLVARSARVPDLAVRAQSLVEARMPEPDLRRTDDPLLRRLLDTGQCRPFTIPTAPAGPAASRSHAGARTPGTPGTHGPWPGRSDAGGYETGALAVTQRPSRLVDAGGRAHPRRFAYGVPTEGVTWVTAAGIRPCADSVTVGDADAIARAALELTRSTSGDHATPAHAPRTKFAELTA